MKRPNKFQGVALKPNKKGPIYDVWAKTTKFPHIFQQVWKTKTRDFLEAGQCSTPTVVSQSERPNKGWIR